MAKKKVAKKPAVKKAAKVNKSAAIREYTEKHPNAKPKEIVAALSKSGVKVTPQQVSTVRYAAAKNKPTRTKKASASVNKVSIDSLVSAKKFADGVGGIESAKELLSTLAKLSD